MEQSNLLRLRRLKALGHDVEVIALTPLGALAPQLSAAGISFSPGLRRIGRVLQDPFLVPSMTCRSAPAAMRVNALILPMSAVVIGNCGWLIRPQEI